MRHPSTYTTVPLGSMHIMQVDAGSVVTDEQTGETVTINDETCAVKGNVVFCTARVFEELKALTSPEETRQ